MHVRSALAFQASRSCGTFYVSLTERVTWKAAHLSLVLVWSWLRNPSAGAKLEVDIVSHIGKERGLALPLVICGLVV